MSFSMMRTIYLYNRSLSASGLHWLLRSSRIRLRYLPMKNMSSLVDSMEEAETVFSDNEIEMMKIAEDKTVLYSSYMSKKLGIGSAYKEKFYLKKKQRKYEEELKKREPVPLIIENMLAQKEEIAEEGEVDERYSDFEESKVRLPFTKVENIDVDALRSEIKKMEEHLGRSARLTLRESIAEKMRAYEEDLLKSPNSLESMHIQHQERPGKTLKGDLNDVSSYNLPIFTEDDLMEYGTSDSSLPVSRVPCGGCGALLHCQDSGLPGFMPKEVFEGLDAGQLRSRTCQRCYFLERHNTALNVRVSPEVYEKLLEPIRQKIALVIVVVDILDFPCSIWPNIIDIIGTRRPVVVVGNKVDLLPADGFHHLRRVKESFVSAIDSTSLGRANIRHVALVSAQTGYGIESLITKIQNSWGAKGDVYIVGCTNGGKSTLFNTLLGSDFCKTQASDLIRRATTSPWPGTTLNMLKFPLLRPSEYRQYLRTMRLKEQQGHSKLQKVKQFTKDASEATVSGHIGRTYANAEPEEASDAFSIKASRIPKEKEKILGVNESHRDYVDGNWCYDTPGTVQPDQMINLLTHEELMTVLPKQLIKPRTFSFTPGKSLFIGGLARLDVLYCPKPVKLTVFASSEVPITVVRTAYASGFYRNYLGTPFLGVPVGDKERLKYWPHLMPCNLRLMSHTWSEACGDVVLSSAGWVTVTGGNDQVVEMRGWTPEGRGIYLRTPSLLPNIVSLRGARIGKSPAYRPHKLMIPIVKESY